MARRYPQHVSGDPVMPAKRNFRLMCCDCGLVHTFNFYVRKRDAKLVFVMHRNNRATAQLRRHRHFEKD